MVVPHRTTPYTDRADAAKHHAKRREAVLTDLNRSSSVTGSQYALLWVGPAGHTEVYSSSAFKQRADIWLNLTIKKEAQALAQAALTQLPNGGWMHFTCLGDEEEEQKKAAARALKAEQKRAATCVPPSPPMPPLQINYNYLRQAQSLSPKLSGPKRKREEPSQPDGLRESKALYGRRAPVDFPPLASSSTSPPLMQASYSAPMLTIQHPRPLSSNMALSDYSPSSGPTPPEQHADLSQFIWSTSTETQSLHSAADAMLAPAMMKPPTSMSYLPPVPFPEPTSRQEHQSLQDWRWPTEPAHGDLLQLQGDPSYWVKAEQTQITEQTASYVLEDWERIFAAQPAQDIALQPAYWPG